MNRLFFLCVLSLLCSCGMNNDLKNVTVVSQSDFEYQELQGENFELDSVWKPIRIFSHDSVLFLVDNLGDYFVSSYNLNDKRFLSNNVPSGTGPNESTVCWDLKVVNNKVYMSDPQLSVIRVYDYNDFITQSAISPKNNLFFEHSPIRFSITNNNEFAVLDLTDFSSLITVCDSTGRRLDKTIPFPTGESGESIFGGTQRKYQFRNKIDYNSDNDRLIVYYDYSDLLDIYDGNFNLLKRVFGPYCFFPEIIGGESDCRLTPDSRYSYETGCLSSKYIYLLYNGLTDIEDDESEEYYTKILSFDYAGNPHKIYTLDIPVFFITVCEETHTIYGLADNPERCVVKFNY